MLDKAASTSRLTLSRLHFDLSSLIGTSSTKSRVQEGQRQQVLRVDIMGAVAGMGPYVELEEQSASSVARRAQINSLEQVISLGERSTCDVEQSSQSCRGRPDRSSEQRRG
jgi:hypothetical protein